MVLRLISLRCVDAIIDNDLLWLFWTQACNRSRAAFAQVGQSKEFSSATAMLLTPNHYSNGMDFGPNRLGIKNLLYRLDIGTEVPG
jgi:hypothetical protein